MERGMIADRVTKVFETPVRKGWLRRDLMKKVAVQDLNLQIRPGQVVGLLGLNGAGKTTTIKMLSTLLLPSSGSITMDGLDVVRSSNAVRRRINMIAGGERMVYWPMTGRENLWYFGQLYDVDAGILSRRMDGLLQQVGLTDAADTPVERYSKGMKQRLQIARGLINDPDYLFLDEPTLGLDAPIARDLRQMVREMAQSGKGILLTSHYLAEVEELCSLIYILDHGRLVATGSPADLKALTRREYQIKVLLPTLPDAALAALHGLSASTGAIMSHAVGDEGVIVTVRHATNLGGQVAATITLQGGTMLRLEVHEPTLEDAILALSGAPMDEEGASHAAS